MQDQTKMQGKMALSDAIARLQELREGGALTEDEFAQAKSRVLKEEEAASSSSDAASERRLRLMELQIEIAHLDREWAQERERHTLSGRYGSRYIPTKDDSLLRGTALVIIGTCLLLLTISSGQLPLSGLFGVVVIVGGIATGRHGFEKAEAYQQAEAAYEEKRSALQARLDRLQQTDT